MIKTVGICSACGGSVVLHQGPWMGVIPPTPYCVVCNAKPVNSNLPVIEISNVEYSQKLLHS